MADNKKSVLLYCDLIHTVEKLDNETAGELFKHYLRYINDLNPETKNVLVDVVFEPIKQNLKRDLKKWEEKIDKRSDAGNKSAGKKAFDKWLDKIDISKITKEQHLDSVGYCKKKQPENYGTYMYYYYEYAIVFHNKEAVRLESVNADSTKSTHVESGATKLTVIDKDNVTDIDTVIVKDINNNSTSFPESEKLQSEIIEPETIIPEKEEKKKSSAKKRKEEIFPDCKKYFLDYYLNQKGVDFYWTAADAIALNKLIQKIRVVSGNKEDSEVLQLFYVFVDKVKAADSWIYDNLSVKILNSKFNELIPKMKSVNAAGQKTNIPNGYEELMQKHQNNINNGKS